MGHYYNYYNNKYNTQENIPKEDVKEPPTTLIPQDKKDTVPVFWQDNPCYCKAKDFAVRCGQLCICLTQKNNMVITGYATQLSRSSSSVLLNLSEGITPYISNKEKILRFTISMREAQESISNLLLISEIVPTILSPNERDALIKLAEEIIAILNKSIYTIKRKM